MKIVVNSQQVGTRSTSRGSAVRTVKGGNEVVILMLASGGHVVTVGLSSNVRYQGSR